MSKKIKIGSFEAGCLIMSFIFAQIYMDFSQIVVSSAANAAWMTVISLSIAVLLIFAVFYSIMKNFSGKDILDVCEYTFGKKGKLILGIVIIIFLLIRVTLVFKQAGGRLVIMAYTNSPLSFITAFYAIAASVAAYAGFQAIARIAKIFVPFIAVSLILIIIGNINLIDYGNLFPIFGNGLKETFSGGLEIFSIFISMIGILFLPPYMTDSKTLKKTGLWTLAIGGVFLTLITLTYILIYPYPSGQDVFMPIYLLSKMVSFGGKIQKLESIFILIWVMGIIVYISAVLNLIFEIIKKTFDIKDARPLIIPTTLIIYFISNMPIESTIIQNIEYKFLYNTGFYIVFVVPFLILISANIKRALRKK